MSNLQMTLRERYRWLYMLEEFMDKDEQIDKGWLMEEIADTKRTIRRIINRHDDGRKIIKNDDGYCVLLIEMPENIHSKEDAEEWFEENERMEYRPTYYDCTGQLFTSWYKIFERHGKYMVYHGISMDI